MPARAVAPHVQASAVLADEFDMDVSYETWRPGGSGDWLLLLTTGGAGAIGLPGGPLLTGPGDFLLYEPGAAQDYATAPVAGRWRFRWAHFTPRPAWHDWLRWPEVAAQTRLVHLPAAWRRQAEEALGRAVRASRRPGPVHAELAFAALEEAVLCGWAAGAREKKPGDPRVERAAALLTDRFKEPFQLPALARECGLSVSRLSHLFRAEQGKTPGQFIEERRLAHAADLLRRTALTVGEIAAECGFADPFYFTNRFRRRHEASPTGFREKARKNG